MLVQCSPGICQFLGPWTELSWTGDGLDRDRTGSVVRSRFGLGSNGVQDWTVATIAYTAYNDTSVHSLSLGPYQTDIKYDYI